uniref:Uncharacterized protein n=1 Tax=Lepeophtheirus salmonis TaxID=72036 RepID=A0A0K2V968_LEPSM
MWFPVGGVEHEAVRAHVQAELRPRIDASQSSQTHLSYAETGRAQKGPSRKGDPSSRTYSWSKGTSSPNDSGSSSNYSHCYYSLKNLGANPPPI